MLNKYGITALAVLDHFSAPSDPQKRKATRVRPPFDNSPTFVQFGGAIFNATCSGLSHYGATSRRFAVARVTL
jgi:hypothetical protein